MLWTKIQSIKEMTNFVGYFTLCLVILAFDYGAGMEWQHSAVLDNNFLVLWTPGEKDVTFEVQVKTLGYVGLGFTKDETSDGADMVIGWVDNNGQVHLQVSPLIKFNYIIKSSLDWYRVVSNMDTLDT